jgi:hypothetical protein
MTGNQDKAVGLTKDSGWQIGVRRTLEIPSEVLWSCLVSMEGIKIWLGEGDEFPFLEGAEYQLHDGTRGEIRVIQEDSHWRLTRQPPDKSYIRPSIMQVRVIKKDSKSVLAFHEEHLPHEEARQDRKLYYQEVINRLKDYLEKESIQ